MRTASLIHRVHGETEDTLRLAAQPREAEQGWNRRLTPNSGDGSRVMATIFGEFSGPIRYCPKPSLSKQAARN